MKNTKAMILILFLIMGLTAWYCNGIIDLGLNIELVYASEILGLFGLFTQFVKGVEPKC